MKSQSRHRIIMMLIIAVATIVTMFLLVSCQDPYFLEVPDTASKADTTQGQSHTDSKDSTVFRVQDVGSSKSDIGVAPSDTSDVTPLTDTEQQQRRIEEPLQVFEKTGTGLIWFNNEPHNYTLKFPDWMNKKVTEDDGLELSGNAKNKEALSEEEMFSVPSFTITTSYHAYNEYTDGDFEDWFATLQGSPDETVTYKGTTLMLSAMDSGGPYARRTFVPIAMSGAVQLDLVYYSTLEIADENFNQKVKEAFYAIINSTQELFLSM